MSITGWWYQTGIPHRGKGHRHNSEKGTMEWTCQKDSGRPWAGLRSCAQTGSQTPRGWRSLAGAQTHRQRTSAHRTPACSSLTIRGGRLRMQMLTGWCADTSPESFSSRNLRRHQCVQSESPDATTAIVPEAKKNEQESARDDCAITNGNLGERKLCQNTPSVLGRGL